MVLSDIDILAEMNAGRLIFDPAIKDPNDRIDSSAVDLLLHKDLLILPEKHVGGLRHRAKRREHGCDGHTNKTRRTTIHHRWAISPRSWSVSSRQDSRTHHPTKPLSSKDRREKLSSTIRPFSPHDSADSDGRIQGKSNPRNPQLRSIQHPTLRENENSATHSGAGKPPTNTNIRRTIPGSTINR